jgi:hypothetical protein
MKYFLILFFFASGQVMAQEAIYPEVFQNVKGVKVIKAFFSDTLKYSYAVGADGKVISRRDYNKDKVEAKEVYTYENGKIVSLKSYQEREYMYDEDPNSTSYSPKDFKWDSTKVTFEIKYTQGPNGIVYYKYYANPGNELLKEISYTYGPDGRLKKEDIRTYPKSGSLSHSKAGSPASRYKEFAYEPNLTTMYFYIDGKLTGTENIVATTDGRITTSIIKNNKGRIIGRVNYEYNTMGRLMEKHINDTGEDGFGMGHPIVFDSEVYSYDENGRMVAKVSYLKGRLVSALAYRYEE